MEVDVQISKTPELVVTVSVYDGGSGPAPEKVTLISSIMHSEHGVRVGVGAGAAWHRLARATRAAVIVKAFMVDA